MLARLQKAQKKDSGFTLIELLVVIVIIGILAGIAIPLFLSQRQKGVDSSLKSDLKNAATTIETWAVDNPSAAVPAGDSSASAALADFTPSEGNTVAVFAGAEPGSYCIEAFNTGASDAISATASLVYDSAAGGLREFADDSSCN